MSHQEQKFFYGTIPLVGALGPLSPRLELRRRHGHLAEFTAREQRRPIAATHDRRMHSAG